MENVIKTIREGNPKRIVVVFGCGGNRSKQRRYDCGRVASRYADFSIITEDNSRYEDVKLPLGLRTCERIKGDDSIFDRPERGDVRPGPAPDHGAEVQHGNHANGGN